MKCTITSSPLNHNNKQTSHTRSDTLSLYMICLSSNSLTFPNITVGLYFLFFLVCLFKNEGYVNIITNTIWIKDNIIIFTLTSSAHKEFKHLSVLEDVRGKCGIISRWIIIKVCCLPALPGFNAYPAVIGAAIGGMLVATIATVLLFMYVVRNRSNNPRKCDIATRVSHCTIFPL